MDGEEYPLLHYADLMHVMLKVAAEGQARLDTVTARIRGDLDLAREALPISETELRTRLDRARRYLAAAKLIEPEDGEPFRATGRGHGVLADHPAGIDDSVLAQFPEFRDFIRQLSGTPPAPPELNPYDEGHAAHGKGIHPADNPYPVDTRAHLAWENGWFEARDEADDHMFPKRRD